jgi:hypothetical protein
MIASLIGSAQYGARDRSFVSERAKQHESHGASGRAELNARHGASRRFVRAQRAFKRECCCLGWRSKGHDYCLQHTRHACEDCLDLERLHTVASEL